MNNFCNNCGQPTGGAKYCPTCGAEQYSNFSDQMGELGGSAAAFIGILVILLFAVPVLIYNPLVTYWLLIRQRRFPSISETGRRVAFWTSWLYTGMMVLVFALGQLAPRVFAPKTAEWVWLMPRLTLYAILIVFFWSIIKGPFRHHQIKRGILHGIGVVIFMNFAILSMGLLILFNQYIDKEKVAQQEQQSVLINRVTPQTSFFEQVKVNKQAG